jgi:hypothetical protein
MIGLFENERLKKNESNIISLQRLCFKKEKLHYDWVSLCFNDGLMLILVLIFGFKSTQLIRNNPEIKSRKASLSINETTSVNVAAGLTSIFLKSIKNKRCLSAINKIF